MAPDAKDDAKGETPFEALTVEQRAMAAEALKRLELALMRASLHCYRIAAACALIEGEGKTKH